MPDYAALAKQFGGAQSPQESTTKDYSALASHFGGVSSDPIDQAIQQSFDRVETKQIPTFKNRGELFDFARDLSKDDPRYAEIEKQVIANRQDLPLITKAAEAVGLISSPLEEKTGYEKASDYLGDTASAVNKKSGEALLAIPGGDILAQYATKTNRAIARMGDSLIIGPVNEIRGLGNKLRTSTGQDELEPLQGFESAMNEAGFNLEANYMEPGFTRDIVDAVGDITPTAIAGGALLKGVAKAVPAATAMIPNTVTQNVIRSLGSSTTAQDLGYGALAGVGGESGEKIDKSITAKLNSEKYPDLVSERDNLELLLNDAEGDRRQLIEDRLSEINQTLEGSGTVGKLIGSIALPMGVGAGKELFRKTPKTAAIPESVKSARQAEEATGIDLLPAQRSLDPQQLKAQRFLPELSPASKTASAALAKQNKQASSAVDDFLKMVGPDDAVVGSNERFRTASEKALAASRAIREEKASPLYNKAFSGGAKVDVDPVKKAIASTADDFPASGGVARTMKRVGDLVGDGGSVKRMHNAKLEIDDMLNKVGDGSLGNTAKRQLREVKQILVDQIEDAAPDYKKARLAFEKASGPVNKLEESVIGKIAEMDDTQIKNISKRIFDPAQTDKTSIQAARKIIDEVDPDAWNILLRSEVERRISSIKPELGVSFENTPAKLKNAIFGSGKNREALLSGMTPTQRQNAVMLESALTRAGLGRPGGSETAGRQEFIKDLDNGIVSTIRGFLKAPVDRAVSVGESTAFDKKAKALAETLFNPTWAPEAKQALKDKSGKSFGYLLYQVNEAVEREDEKRKQ